MLCYVMLCYVMLCYVMLFVNWRPWIDLIFNYFFVYKFVNYCMYINYCWKYILLSRLRMFISYKTYVSVYCSCTLRMFKYSMRGLNVYIQLLLEALIGHLKIMESNYFHCKWYRMKTLYILFNLPKLFLYLEMLTQTLDILHAIQHWKGRGKEREKQNTDI